MAVVYKNLSIKNHQIIYFFRTVICELNEFKIDEVSFYVSGSLNRFFPFLLGIRISTIQLVALAAHM